MGQYYTSLIEDQSGNKRVFGLQICDRPYWTTPDREYIGIKLMEHAWLCNKFMQAFATVLLDSPHKVWWVGDYTTQADDIPDRPDLTADVRENVYDICWNEESSKYIKEEILDGERTSFYGKYIINHDRGEYIDVSAYADALEELANAEGEEWIICPIPLLTVVSNGLGGGDYYGSCMDKIGTWAGQTIEIVSDPDKLEGLTDETSKYLFREEY